MSKKKKIGITLLSLAILIGGAGWFVYNQITDYVIANMIENMLMEELELQDLGLQDIPIEGGEVLPVEQIQETPTNQVAETTPSSSQETDAVTNEASSTQGTSNQASTPKQAKTKVDIQAQVKEVVKSIPTKDKSEVMRLVVQNLSSSDIRHLSSLVTDGEISSSDMAEAKAVALRSFTEEELEDVKSYYYQYIGLLSELYPQK